MEITKILSTLVKEDRTEAFDQRTINFFPNGEKNERESESVKLFSVHVVASQSRGIIFRFLSFFLSFFLSYLLLIWVHFIYIYIRNPVKN